MSSRRAPRPSRRPDGTTRPRGKRLSKWETGRFVAWDGEGVTTGGRHRYLMLRSSEKGGLTSAKGLRTADLLHALVEGLVAAPDAWHVGFAFGYDVNMIVGDFRPAQLFRLHKGRWVVWRQYRLRYRRAKCLTVQRYRLGRWEGGTVWDVFGFFQASFVRSCEAYQIGSEDERRQVLAMKTERARFCVRDLPAIEQYCEHECRLLVQLMTKVKAYCEEAGLRLSRWDGAGAVASSLLNREGVKPLKSDEGETPDAVQDAVQTAFAGGRIELLRYGHLPGETIHHYDINSAYPDALQNVPCLRHGRWVHSDDGRNERRSSFTVARLSFAFRRGQACYPFFWRAPDGRIFYPPSGRGWYWRPEVDAALDAIASGALSGSFTVEESWTWEPECDERPFGFIPPLFAQRQTWKAQGRGAEKMLKLGLNSLYGKCAQHVGGTTDSGPPWHQLEWAGWTTSATRARLYRAALAAGSGSVFLATDGLYSTQRIESLPLGKTLGTWDYAQHTGLTTVQSGVYWVDDAATTKAYHRGFDPGSLDRAKIVRAWERGSDTVRASSTRFFGMGQALAGATSWERWRQWVSTPRVLQLTPLGTKRMDADVWPKPHRGLVRTYAYDPRLEALGRDSTPASLPWRPLAGPMPMDEAIDADSEDAIF